MTFKGLLDAFINLTLQAFRQGFESLQKQWMALFAPYHLSSHLLGGTECARRRGAVKVGVVGRSKGNIKLAQQSIVSKECK